MTTDSAKLQSAAIVRNLTTLTPDEQSRLRGGLEAIPINRVYQHAQWLQNILLPKVEQSKGRNSDEYKHFKSIHDTLIWSIHLMELHDRILHQWSNEKLLSEFYRNKCLFYEQQLTKYTTQEELLFNETMQACSNTIARGRVLRASEPNPFDEIL